MSKKIFLAVALLALTSSLYWFYIFFVMSVTNIQLYWLPLGNVACILLSLYVDSDMRTLANEVDALSQFKYDFKTA